MASDEFDYLGVLMRPDEDTTPAVKKIAIKRANEWTLHSIEAEATCIKLLSMEKHFPVLFFEINSINFCRSNWTAKPVGSVYLFDK